MNELSWMLYIADVSGVARVALGIGGVASLLLMLVWAAIAASEKDVTGPGKLLILPFIAITSSVLLPSSSTVYAIAASEMGEDVLKSPTVTKAQKALDAWLDRQLDDGAPQ